MACDIVFHEDSPFYKPLEQQIFCPASTNDSILSVSQSTREDRDFDPGVDDVENLSSDDFDHATDEEEEGEPKHSGESHISKKNTLSPGKSCTPSPPEGPGAYNLNSSSGCICPGTCLQGATMLHRAATANTQRNTLPPDRAQWP